MRAQPSQHVVHESKHWGGGKQKRHETWSMPHQLAWQHCCGKSKSSCQMPIYAYMLLICIIYIPYMLFLHPSIYQDLVGIGYQNQIIRPIPTCPRWGETCSCRNAHADHAGPASGSSWQRGSASRVIDLDLTLYNYILVSYINIVYIYIYTLSYM